MRTTDNCFGPAARGGGRTGPSRRSPSTGPGHERRATPMRVAGRSAPRPSASSSSATAG